MPQVQQLGTISFMLCSDSLTISSVYLGYNSETHQKAAIKIFYADVPSEHIRDEKEIMERFNHPNLISLYDYFENIDFEDCRGSSFKISGFAMEYAACGSILELISVLGCLPEVLSRTLFHQLIEALDHLHGKNIAHRDIKPENLLLDQGYCLKLADFGHSIDLKKSHDKHRVGTSRYFSPEMHSGGEFDPKAGDIFAAAVMLFCMISGSMPFYRAAADDEVYRYLINGNLQGFWGFHEGAFSGNSRRLFTEDLKDLFEKMLHVDPKKRLSIQEIKGHAWYQKEILDKDVIGPHVRELLK